MTNQPTRAIEHTCIVEQATRIVEQTSRTVEQTVDVQRTRTVEQRAPGV